MKNIVLALLVTLFFLGCNDAEALKKVEPKLVVEKSISSLTLNDQNGKTHSISPATKSIIFAFSKDIGHKCNEFLATKEPSYLESKNALFIADVSSAPSLIRSMFILPGLKDFKHTVLILDDKSVAQGFSKDMDKEKIVVVTVENSKITKIENLSSVKELEERLN